MSNQCLISVIIPAHNEEAVIQRTLDALLKTANRGDFEVIVVCNGCRDRTAQIAGIGFDNVAVLELENASKTAAINAGLRQAKGSTTLLLDADIELATESARALARAVGDPGIEVAIGHMDVDTIGTASLVKAFYRVWMEHPYLKNGKFAAAIALSREGVTRIGSMPNITADDTYLRQLFPQDRVSVVSNVNFKVRAPRTLSSLLRVRSRSYRGTRELAQLSSAGHTHSAEARGLLRNVLQKPGLWPYLPAYLGITLTARALSYRDSGSRWERDLTTRTPLAK